MKRAIASPDELCRARGAPTINRYTFPNGETPRDLQCSLSLVSIRLPVCPIQLFPQDRRTSYTTCVLQCTNLVEWLTWHLFSFLPGWRRTWSTVCLHQRRKIGRRDIMLTNKVWVQYVRGSFGKLRVRLSLLAVAWLAFLRINPVRRVNERAPPAKQLRLLLAAVDACRILHSLP